MWSQPPKFFSTSASISRLPARSDCGLAKQRNEHCQCCSHAKSDLISLRMPLYDLYVCFVCLLPHSRHYLSQHSATARIAGKCPVQLGDSLGTQEAKAKASMCTAAPPPSSCAPEKYDPFCTNSVTQPPDGPTPRLPLDTEDRLLLEEKRHRKRHQGTRSWIEGEHTGHLCKEMEENLQITFMFCTALEITALMTTPVSYDLR